MNNVVLDSIYVDRINDNKAFYFSEDLTGVKSDGTTDVSDILQREINGIVEKYGYGILYVKEGKYLLSKTIYIPKAVRIIGYGKNRPKFILKDNAPGFDKPVAGDKGGFRYLFWFVDLVVTDEALVEDANPGTFYSAMSNIDLELGNGNSYAVGLRTHYAQHSFVSYMNINVDSAMAGIYDVGNEMENISIIGGQYGIITTKCSPGWPFAMVDTYFEGQKNCAIKTHEAGLTIVRCQAKDVPLFISVDDGYFDRVFIENGVMNNVGRIIEMSMEFNSLSQVSIKSICVDKESVLVRYKDTNRECTVSKGAYSYEFGTMISDSESERNIREKLTEIEECNPEDMLKSDLRHAPDTGKWIDVTELGLIGDGLFDNTKLLSDAVAQYDVLFFPQGDYLFTNQITLGKNTVLIGMHPFSTKLILKENSEAYTGFGSMKPFVETAYDSDNMINGIGLDTGGRNPRACALLWHGGKNSYINDVKLIGCHGTLVEGTGAFLSPYNESRTADADVRKQWDAQYPSLVVKNGGGTFKDIWTASTYAIAGVEIADSNIPSKVYCISLEHHQRSEITMRNSSNWHFYAIQTEEEFAEGEFACPIVLRNSSNIEFNMAYFFRTIWVNRACPCCVRVYGGKNIVFNCINNVTQMKYTFDNFLIHEGSDGKRIIRPWQGTKVLVGCDFDESYRICNSSKSMIVEAQILRKYDGFRFADGTVSDSKGNVYFVDSTDKRVYRINKENETIDLVLDSPIKVNSLTIDTEDNLVGVGEYFIPAEATLDGKLIDNTLPEDAHFTSYGKWYYPNVVIVAFKIVEGQIIPLEKIKMGSIKPKMVVYSGNRWPDDMNFVTVVQYKAKEAFLMPDGCSIIPCQYDLIRANNLVTCRCRESFYSVDELYKRVYISDTDEYGYVSNPREVVSQGDYCVRAGKCGDIFVGDDNIKHYDEDGQLTEIIQMKERPTTFELDESGKVSYVATRHSVYKIKY